MLVLETYERLALFEKFVETYCKDAAPWLLDQATARFRSNHVQGLGCVGTEEGTHAEEFCSLFVGWYNMANNHLAWSRYGRI